MTHIKDYLKALNEQYQTGKATEHSYRGPLQILMQNLAPGAVVTNEPARIACGAPDYILTRNDIPVGYIEAKDIGQPLTGKAHQEQFDRYRNSLTNLIITDYLDFQIYREGQLTETVSIGTVKNGRINGQTANFSHFIDLMTDFCAYRGQTITAAGKLSKMMAGKAKLMAAVIEKALNSDEQHADNTALKDQMNAFRDILIHDIKPKEFADIYAQTIAYGMFAARLHDQTPHDFSRQEAALLIPKSNPFLRKLFQYIAGYDLDERIDWIVDSLAEVFRATDMPAILADFGKATQQNDPMIHFYETFLAEYDPKLRKSRGVWYTPEPVVNFIVRAVDDILKTEFNLPQGLADTSKTTVDVQTQTPDKREKGGYKLEKVSVHRVQILDPATGTGTFLAEVIKQIHAKFAGQQGVWSQYVENHLIPRLNGFEILMASYAMAHLKLEFLLRETGYIPTKNQRFRVFLTNSLEEHNKEIDNLFGLMLSNEAKEADYVKRDTPVMVVLGNPPYSVSSSNKSDWIEKLIADYKKDLNEKNIQPLSDDYIKFIRFGEFFIEKKGEGILAFISNNSFIDGIIHRQMRKHLLEKFDEIYILDLHGSSKKQEKAPDGGIDQNVFDIMQGVSINIFIKKSGHSSNPATLHHFDGYGKRQQKYELLNSSGINSVEWQILTPQAPEFFFVPKDFELQQSYERGFSVNNFFGVMSSGIKTHRDHFVINFDTSSLRERVQTFYDESLTTDAIRKSLKLNDNRDWSLVEARRMGPFERAKLKLILYRPFDLRPIYYESSLIDFGRENIMHHILAGSIAFMCFRQSRNKEQGTFWMSNTLVGKDALSSLDTCSVFPLYLYPDDRGQQTIDGQTERRPNLNEYIVSKIAAGLDLRFEPEKTDEPGTLAPLDILDYIYAVLHSPAYREKYQEFLKIDFPRVPYPADPERFWQLVKLGGELRGLHLLESPAVMQFITTYPVTGANAVTRRMLSGDFELTGADRGRVWINDTQYFDGVPVVAWNFYIGGYQPAQKWLKDRKGRQLSFDDIMHYQKVIVALTETARVMREIDGVLVV